MSNYTRLDILLYAHDGRGLGHASRTIAIGLALRRLFPALKVLFLTGCKVSQELIGSGTLDWMKLPSYETVVVNGRSKGVKGASNFEDQELGKIRGEQIKQLINLYRPRLVLADHSPQGKHRELLPALQDSSATDTNWVLGIRGVPGNVSQLCSETALSAFRSHYLKTLWYGDSQILGREQINDVAAQFDTSPEECGYVSRLKEIMRLETTSRVSPHLAGTVAVPWLGENSRDFLCRLAGALKKLGPRHGEWKLFIDENHQHSHEIYTLFSTIDFCHIEPPGSRYTGALLNSRTAVIYGGYNSLMDILSLSLPALVILRDMQDGEQQLHLHKLLQTTGKIISALPEHCDEDTLFSHLLHILTQKSDTDINISMDGAERAACHLASLLPNTSHPD